uniref:Uncharacterized protein n=1 Tax=Solanum tuberosum TaxID=4113 RepID=M1B7C4_SOLTU
MLFPALRGCCKSAALSELSRVQKLSSFSLFKATAAAVFWRFYPILLFVFGLLRLLWLLLSWDFNPIILASFRSAWMEIDSKRGVCKKRSPLDSNECHMCKERKKRD